jgi:hypothetical protein
MDNINNCTSLKKTFFTNMFLTATTPLSVIGGGFAGATGGLGVPAALSLMRPGSLAELSLLETSVYHPFFLITLPIEYLAIVSCAGAVLGPMAAARQVCHEQNFDPLAKRATCLGVGTGTAMLVHHASKMISRGTLTAPRVIGACLASGIVAGAVATTALAFLRESNTKYQK